MEVVIEEMTVQIGAHDRPVDERLGQELRRLLEERIPGLRHEPSLRGLRELGTVDLGTLELPATRDPAAIAGLIADRLVGWLQDLLTQPEEAR
jgi:hypothetical protein